MKNNECETWEKIVNTYILEAHLSKYSRAKQTIYEIVLARSAEEAISIIKSFPLYRDAIIDRVELRDRNVIIGNSGSE